MSVQQYDRIGEAFEGFKALPLVRYGEVPSVLALVGDGRGKTVLDLACGTGFYSRKLRRRGAAEVLGIDISSEMIAGEWVPLRISEEGLREYGEDFWADALAHPPLELLRCRA
ncbi:class I SAM-dependent methyltransferase [Kitasatospora sp. NPDC017646]|uniref:class I SAM-dependent methyltransferase n=1 Tax=Kitasatospora sp. NPDC017646 TaxID=3364024 RepID=UPI0037B78149